MCLRVSSIQSIDWRKFPATSYFLGLKWKLYVYDFCFSSAFLFGTINHGFPFFFSIFCDSFLPVVIISNEWTENFFIMVFFAQSFIEYTQWWARPVVGCSFSRRDDPLKGIKGFKKWEFKMENWFIRVIDCFSFLFATFPLFLVKWRDSMRFKVILGFLGFRFLTT